MSRLYSITAHASARTDKCRGHSAGKYLGTRVTATSVTSTSLPHGSQKPQHTHKLIPQEIENARALCFNFFVMCKPGNKLKSEEKSKGVANGMLFLEAAVFPPQFCGFAYGKVKEF